MKKKKALVIDDEHIVLESVSRILKEMDIKADVADNGTQGLRLAMDKAYDLVLTDLRMPDISGMSVLRDVKRARPAIPVVMITGYGTVQSAVQALKLGAAEYIEKPFSPEELSAVVQSALKLADVLGSQEQRMLHKEEVLRVLSQGAADPVLAYSIMQYGADALDEFNLTGPEKLAILTGDIQWIEKHAGPLSQQQREWLEQRLAAEVW